MLTRGYGACRAGATSSVCKGEAKIVPYTVAPVYAQATRTGTVGGTVPATLSVTLGAPASFGAFTPGRGSTRRRLGERDQHGW